MAKKKKNKDYQKRDTSKKVVVNTSSEKKLKPTVSKLKSKKATVQRSEELLFGRENFILLGIGAALVVLGLIMMVGGAQDPNEWNADEVYSVRTTVLAPMLILAGLAVELYAIFKKKNVA